MSRSAGMCRRIRLTTGWMPYGSAYGLDWYNSLLEYVVVEDGDTLKTWTTNYVVDITDPNCRLAMVEVLRRHPADVDWIMLDFCTVPLRHLWTDRTWPDNERQLVAAFCDLVDLYREAFPGVKILPNGRLVYQSQDFARRCDGCWIETNNLEAYVAAWTGCKFLSGGFSVFEEIRGSGGVEYAQKHPNAFGVVKRGERRELCPVEAVR